MNKLTENYNEQTNKLHDVILIIRELKVELRERNLFENVSANSNTSLFITEEEVIVSVTRPLIPDLIRTRRTRITI